MAGRSAESGGLRALVAAALARECPGPLVIVAPHPSEIDSIARDLALFTNLPIAEFPAWESEPGERVVHDEIYGARLRVLKGLVQGTPTSRAPQPPALPGVESRESANGERIGEAETSNKNPRRSRGLTGGHDTGANSEILVTSIQSLLQPVPGRDALAEATRVIRVGGTIDEQEFTKWLVTRGGHATTAVELPGEFSLRGGILDIFPPDAEDPVRIELFGSDVESIRRFDVATQRSLGSLDAVEVTMLEPTASDRAHFTAYVPPETWFLLIEPNELSEEGKFYLDRMDRPQAFHSVRTTLEEIYKFPSVTAAGVPAGSMEQTAHLEFESVERFSGDIAKVRDELDKVSIGHAVFIVCETEAEVERLGELFKASPLLAEGRLHFVVGHLEAGFRVVPQRVALVSAGELFQRHDLARTTRRRSAPADGRSTASSNCGRATWSCTWPTASDVTVV